MDASSTLRMCERCRMAMCSCVKTSTLKTYLLPVMREAPCAERVSTNYLRHLAPIYYRNTFKAEV